MNKINIKQSKRFLLSTILVIGLLLGSVNSTVNVVAQDDWHNPAQGRVDQVFKNPEAQISEDGMVEYRKSIENTGMDEFIITLDVITKSIIEKGVGASVVLVMDISESMERVTPEGRTLLSYSKEAAARFATEFLKQGHKGNLMGLVSYDNIATDEISSPYVPNSPSFTDDASTFVNAVNSMRTFNGQTNIQAGLYKARKILETDTSDNPQYIIVFSDGAANYSYPATNAEPIGATLITPYTSPKGQYFDMTFKLTDFDYSKETTIKGYNVNGYTVSEHYIPTISEAIIAKEIYDIDVYSVFFSNPNIPESEYYEGVFGMMNVATSGQYHELNDIAGLSDLFYKLEQDIINKTKLWKVVDPMGDFVSFDGFPQAQTPPGVSFNNATNTLVWNLLDANVTPQLTDDGRFKYSLSYKIVLQSNDMGFENDKAYQTNKTTTLDYLFNQAASPDNEKKSLEFEVPIVRGASTNDKFLQVLPIDMVAYQGGQSVSGNSFPRPYFSIRDSSGVPLTQDELDKLTFYIDGVPHVPYEHEFFIYEYPFRAYFVNTETGEVHNDPAEQIHTDDMGLYTIRLSTRDMNGHVYYSTAMDDQNNIYDFRFYQNSTLEVRPQYLEKPTVFTNYIEGAPSDLTNLNEPTAFVEAGTNFTNSAGIPVETQHYKPDIRLMVDAVMPDAERGILAALGQQLQLNDYKVYMSYLNMVNHENGNIIVTPSKPVTVFYPYPEGADKSTHFKVFHFYKINRGINKPLEFDYDELTPAMFEKGIAFTVDSFSPFVIIHEREKFVVKFDLNGGTGKAPTSQYDDQLVLEGSYVTKPENPAKQGYSFMGWEVREGKVAKLWNFENDKVYTNITLIARWIHNGSNEPVPPVNGGTNGGTIGGGAGGNASGTGTSSGVTINTGNPPKLNKLDHFAFMVGYPDNSFQPSGNMTRAEACMMFAKLMLKQPIIPKPFESSFTDVPESAWYSNAIGYLQLTGIIKEKGDKFRPNAPITRAEFAVLAAGFERLSGSYEPVFRDVPENHWAAQEIHLASKKGWISGYSDKTFRPEQNITRAEVVTLANRMLERKADKVFVRKNKDIVRQFNDLNEDHWAYFEIMEATNAHYYLRNSDFSETWNSIWK